MKVQTRSEEEGTGKLFKVGMTLDEYFGEIKVQKSAEKEEKDEENLYETSQKGQISISKKLITYEIKETDEDNYE